MEEVNQDCVALDIPNGKSKSIKYNEHFVYPSKETMPKCPTNSSAKHAPSLEQATKGIYRK